MQRAYRIRVSYEGLTSHLYREYLIGNTSTLRDLGLLVAVSFDSNADKEIRFDQNGQLISLMRPTGRKNSPRSTPAPETIALKQLRMVRGSRLLVFYGDRFDHTFIVQFIEAVDYDGEFDLPLVLDGAGRGILEELGPYHFIPLVRDILRHGVSEMTYRSPKTGILTEWDIRCYDAREDQQTLASGMDMASAIYE